jgi:hypothetical protein
MKQVILSLLFALSLIGCSSISMKEEYDPIPPTASCDTVPPAQQLTCIRGLLKRAEVIFNDPGKLISSKKLESDSTCSRVEQVLEYGAELPEELRMRRTMRSTICSGSFLERLEDNAIFGGAAFGLGFITGFFLGTK